MGDKLKTFDLQLFGGGGTTVHNQPAKVPEPTPEERALQKEQLKYIQSLNPSLAKLVELGNKALDNGQLNVDYNQLFSQGMNKINALGSSYNDLLNGKINPEFQKNREAAMQSGINNTLGANLNNLSQRGVVNSKVTNKAVSSQQKNIADAMSQGYHQDIATQSQLLGQAEQAAYSPMMFANAAQNAALDLPKAYWSMATGLNAPNNDAWKTMYNGRMSIATPAQSYVSQDSGGGFFGGLMSGVGSFFCFVAGTKIATPYGAINIEDIKEGDSVYTLDVDGNIIEGKVTFVAEPAISSDQYLTIATDKGSVTTTASQPFLSGDDFICADNINVGDTLAVVWNNVATVEKIIPLDEKELVYDFSVEGRNIYFADGFAVEGRSI